MKPPLCTAWFFHERDGRLRRIQDWQTNTEPPPGWRGPYPSKNAAVKAARKAGIL